MKPLKRIACLLWLVSNTLLAGDIVPLAVEGDAAPDGDGTLAGVTAFALKEGTATYSASTTGNAGESSRDFLLATATRQGAKVVFREGDAAPNNGNFWFTSGGISVNAQGGVSFIGALTNASLGTSNNEGVYVGDGSVMTEIARANQPEPMGGPGVLDAFSVCTINTSGQVAFWASIRNAGTPVISTHGIFIGQGSALQQVARTYTTAPDGNGQISGIGTSSRLISDSGNVAYLATLTGTTGGSEDDTAIFMSNGSSSVTIAHEGDLAPGTSGRFGSFLAPLINDNNQVLFYASIRGGGEGFFRGSGSDATKIVLTGELALGGVAVYQTLHTTASINAAGDVSYVAYLNSGISGVFRGNGVETTTIALSGNQAPDGDYTFADFTLAAINNTRTVAFQAALSYATDATGIYMSDGEETVLVAKTGDALNGSTIASLGFDPRAFSDQRLAFQAVLADGKTGFFLFSPTVKWRHDGNGQWADASRWTVSFRPGEYTRVEIDPAGGGVVTGPAGDTTLRSLALGKTSAETSELNLQETSDLTVLEGAEIGGSGKLTGSGKIIGNVTSQGEIAPGNSIGVIKVQGNYTQLPGGSLTLELGGTTVALHDRLLATGNIQLAGTIKIVLSGNFTPAVGDAFTLVSTDGVLSGGFSKILMPYSSGIQWQLTQTGTAVVLTANPAPRITVMAGSPMVYQVAATGGGIPYSVAGLPPGIGFDDEFLELTGSSDAIGHYLLTVTNQNDNTSTSLSLTVAAPSQNNSRGHYAGLMIGDTRLLGAWTLDRTGNAFTGTFTCAEGGLTLRGVFPLTGEIRQVAISGSIKRVSMTGTLKWDKSIDRVTLDISTQGAHAGTVDETGSASSWDARSRLFPHPGVFIAIMLPSTGSTTDQPEGSGFLMLTIKTSGAVQVLGETALGDKITWSGVVPDNYNLPIYWTLTDSSLRGLITTDYGHLPRVDGSLAWNAKANSSRKAYPSGFVQGLDVLGNPWGTLSTLVGLFPSNAAVLQLGGGGLDRILDHLTQPFSLSGKGALLPPSNPYQVKMTINPKTGLVTGQASVTDPSPSPKIKAVKRTIAFRGIMVRNADGAGTDAVGGYFLLPAWDKSVRSGWMEITAP